jgi:hypothetical protein
MIYLAIFAGQSNALGFGMSAATLPSPLQSADLGQTYIWGANYGVRYWGAMQAGVNTGNSDAPQAWGPEVQFAYDFRQAHPNDVLLIVKVALGSTGLAADPAELDWSPSTHELFDLTTANINRARAAFTAAQGTEAPLPSVVFWMQGEADAGTQASAGAYRDNLTDFLAHVRSDWMHDPAGKVVAPRITDSPWLNHNLTVRQAQWLVDQEDDNLVTFKTIGFEMQPDLIHYGPDGYTAIGSGYYTAFNNWF